MSGETGLRYCPECDDEYHSWVTRCVDCRVDLVDEAAHRSTLASRDDTDDDERVLGSAEMSIAGLAGDQRELLVTLLRGEEIPFELSSDVVQVPRVRRADVDELIDWVREAGPVDEAPPSASPRPFVRLTDDGQVVAARWRRLGGWYLDTLVVTALAAGADYSGVPPWVVTVVAAVYVIGAVAVWGRTLGKLVVGTKVVRIATGRPPGLAASGVRWLVLGWAGAFSWLGWSPLYYAGFVAFLVVHLPIMWDRLGRGLHDHVAATTVVEVRGHIPHSPVDDPYLRSSGRSRV